MSLSCGGNQGMKDPKDSPFLTWQEYMIAGIGATLGGIFAVGLYTCAHFFWSKAERLFPEHGLVERK